MNSKHELVTQSLICESTQEGESPYPREVSKYLLSLDALELPTLTKSHVGDASFSIPFYNFHCHRNPPFTRGILCIVTAPEDCVC